MAIYSDEKRPVLAKWIKFTLLLNVVFFILLVLIWVFIAGVSHALYHTGLNATILIGLNVAAFLFYEQLFRPDDDPGRRAAEVLGSLQVVAACISLLMIVGAMGLAVVPGLAGTAAGPQGPSAANGPQAAIPAAPQVSTEPTNCYQTSTGCLPIPPDPTIPPYGDRSMAGDPVIGSFIFDKSQFSPKEEYNSKAGNYEYNYRSVPLDHSPDIRWTFREDGVLLFSDNNKGELLRLGTWTKTDSSKWTTEYRIKRGNTEYRGSFITKDIFQIHTPDFWNMTKV